MIVTSENASNITGEGITGKISFDPTTLTLTLDHATVNSSIMAYEATATYLYGAIRKIRVIGHCSAEELYLTGGWDANTKKLLWHDVTIEGVGSDARLDLTTDYVDWDDGWAGTGLWLANECNIIVSNVYLNIYSKYGYAIYADVEGGPKSYSDGTDGFIRVENKATLEIKSDMTDRPNMCEFYGHKNFEFILGDGIEYLYPSTCFFGKYGGSSYFTFWGLVSWPNVGPTNTAMMHVVMGPQPEEGELTFDYEILDPTARTIYLYNPRGYGQTLEFPETYEVDGTTYTVTKASAQGGMFSKLILPKTVVEVPEYAFADCVVLSEVNYLYEGIPTLEQCPENAFSTQTKAYGEGSEYQTIYKQSWLHRPFGFFRGMQGCWNLFEKKEEGIGEVTLSCPNISKSDMHTYDEWINLELVKDVSGGDGDIYYYDIYHGGEMKKYTEPILVTDSAYIYTYMNDGEGHISKVIGYGPYIINATQGLSINGGKAINSDTEDDVLGDGGSVKYDRQTRTLTLTNARIDDLTGFAAKDAAGSDTYDFTIRVIGENYITGGISFDNSQLAPENATFNIIGEGETSILHVGGQGISPYLGNVKIQEAKVYANGISTQVGGGDLTVRFSLLDINNEATDGVAVRGFKNFVTEGVSITTPKDAQFYPYNEAAPQIGNFLESDCDTQALSALLANPQHIDQDALQEYSRYNVKHLIIAKEDEVVEYDDYGFMVGGVLVTKENADNLSGEYLKPYAESVDAYAKYDRETNTLTLKNMLIGPSGTGCIEQGDYYKTRDLNIELIGQNYFTQGYECAIYWWQGNLTFHSVDGYGLLTDTDRENEMPMFITILQEDNVITIDHCVLDLAGITPAAEGSLIMKNNATLKAYAGVGGIKNRQFDDNIVLLEPEGAWWSEDGSVMINVDGKDELAQNVVIGPKPEDPVEPELEWRSMGQPVESKTYGSSLIGQTSMNDMPYLHNPKRLPVSYSSSDENVATIASNGVTLLTGVGSTIISASFEGNERYTSKTVEYQLNVEQQYVEVEAPKIYFIHEGGEPKTRLVINQNVAEPMFTMPEVHTTPADLDVEWRVTTWENPQEGHEAIHADVTTNPLNITTNADGTGNTTVTLTAFGSNNNGTARAHLTVHIYANEYVEPETVEVTPVREDATTELSDVEGEDLSNNFYKETILITLNEDGGDGFDDDEGCLVLATTVSQQEVAAANEFLELGSADYASAYSGLTIPLGEGEGTVTINYSTTGESIGAIQVGDSIVSILESDIDNQREEVTVNYSNGEVCLPMQVYNLENISTNPMFARRKLKREKTLRASVKSDDVVKIYSVTITPTITGIPNTYILPQTNDNIYYDLQGRRVVNPTKGIYVVNGRKMLLK